MVYKKDTPGYDHQINHITDPEVKAAFLATLDNLYDPNDGFNFDTFDFRLWYGDWTNFSLKCGLIAVCFLLFDILTAFRHVISLYGFKMQKGIGA